MTIRDEQKAATRSAATRNYAALPYYMRTNFGKQRESRCALLMVVEEHLKEALAAARKLDLEIVVKTIEDLLG